MSVVPTRAEAKIALLEATSRERVLTDDESLQLERLLNRSSSPRRRRPNPFANAAEQTQLAMFDGPLFDWSSHELAS